MGGTNLLNHDLAKDNYEKQNINESKTEYKSNINQAKTITRVMQSI